MSKETLVMKQLSLNRQLRMIMEEMFTLAESAPSTLEAEERKQAFLPGLKLQKTNLEEQVKQLEAIMNHRETYGYESISLSSSSSSTPATLPVASSYSDPQTNS